MSVQGVYRNGNRSTSEVHYIDWRIYCNRILTPPVENILAICWRNFSCLRTTQGKVYVYIISRETRHLWTSSRVYVCVRPYDNAQGRSDGYVTDTDADSRNKFLRLFFFPLFFAYSSSAFLNATNLWSLRTLTFENFWYVEEREV